MKQLLTIVFVLCMASVAFGAISDKCVPGDIQTGNAVISALPARLCDLAVYTNGTNAVTVICYDNASAGSGKVIAKAIVSGSVNAGGDFISTPRIAYNGIYCTVSGTGGTYRVDIDVQ